MNRAFGLAVYLSNVTAVVVGWWLWWKEQNP